MDDSTVVVIRALFGLLAAAISVLVLKYVIAAGVREGMRKARADEKQEAARIGSSVSEAKVGK